MMDSKIGRLTFEVESTQVDICITNLIHIKEDTNVIDQLSTETNVYIVIESEMKSRGLNGKVKNIRLYDMRNNLIAYDDKEERGKLIYK